jgi:hypothetical protein
MTVEAGHPQLASVLLVRERDRLGRRIADARVLGRAVVIKARHAEDRQEDRSGDRSAKPGVSAPREDQGQDGASLFKG